MRAKVVTVMRWYAQDEVNQEDRMRLTEWRRELTTSHRHWSQTTIAFHLVNVLSRARSSAVYRQRQSVSCCVRSSVELYSISISCRRCSISLHLALSSQILSRLSFFISISDFFHLFSARAVTCHFWHYKSLLHLHFYFLDFFTSAITAECAGGCGIKPFNSLHRRAIPIMVRVSALLRWPRANLLSQESLRSSRILPVGLPFLELQ